MERLIDGYLELLERRLTGLDCRHEPAKAPRAFISGLLYRELSRRMPTGTQFMRRIPLERRAKGLDWPGEAESMIGVDRLRNIRECIEALLVDGIPGDLIETGVWRGGASIYMRAVLFAHGDEARRVWVADSFKGLPSHEVTGEARDEELDLWSRTELAVSREEVERNFARYGLLDDRIQFLEGWFHETLPTAPIGALALIRLDGDLYASTMTALTALYHRLSPGGFVIVDDYHTYRQCRDAVEEFRSEIGSTEEMVDVDGSATFWRKSG